MPRSFAALFFALCAGCAAVTPPRSNDDLVQQVTAVEIAFAKTMADRDFVAFQSHIANEAIFMAGPNPLRSRDAVIAHWKRFFASSSAPFSWKPDRVQVLDSGTLAKSSGPVVGLDGKASQRFNSIW